MKQTPWWPHYVESLYRGEHERAKAIGEPSPALAAELRVADELGISAATVHQLCGDIRRLRARCREDANFDAIPLADFRAWLDHGQNETPWG